MAMVMLRYLIAKDYLDCKGVVANLKPSHDRARLLRGTLDTLGLWDVPVGVGTDGGSNTHQSTFDETCKDYAPPRNSQRAEAILPGRLLLQRAFSASEDRSLALICISSLKDAALFVRDNAALFKQKVLALLYEPSNPASKKVHPVTPSATDQTGPIRFDYGWCE